MTTRPLRIAIFHLGFFYSGGGEKLVLEELRGLRAMGHQVHCFAPYVDREGCFPDVTEMAEIQPLLPPPPKWLPTKDALWVTLSCLLIPFLAWRFRSYDVFLGANQPSPWWAFLLSKILRKPYVVYLAQPLRLLHPRKIDTEHGLRIRDGDQSFVRLLTRAGRPLIDWADRVSIRHANVVLTNGSHVSRWIEEVYGASNYICAAGCHPTALETLEYTDRWEGQIEINGISIRKPFALLTNRHSPMKRFEYALWALKSVLREVPSLSLVITGQETRYTDHLRYLVDGLRLNGSVHFVGLVAESDLADLYQESSIYIYPSPEEDFGMGIVEAMAAGTPVVAWNTGGPTVTVKNRETGFLAKPYDTEEFAAVICQLATDHNLAERMGRAGHRRASEIFSYERHHKILENALYAAMDGHMMRLRLGEESNASMGAQSWGASNPGSLYVSRNGGQLEDLSGERRGALRAAPEHVVDLD